MKYKISDMSEVDDKLIELIKKYFFEDIKFDVQYKRYGNLRISKDHPFTRLLSDTRSNRVSDVLPAISLSLVDDTSNDISMNRGKQLIEVDSDLLNELKLQKYSLNRENVFDDLKKILDSGDKLFAEQINRRYAQKMVIEVWSENRTIKDILYEGLKDFLDFYAIDLYNFGIENMSINGKKDGDYNFDFGTVLYGANIILNGVMVNMIFEIDTNIKNISEINHNIDNIKS